MINTTASKVRNLFVGAALAFVAISAVSTAKASAAFVDCVPKIVEYAPNQLLIQCPVSGVATNFFAQVAPVSSCSANAVSIDTIKMWLSMAQSGVLSQKTMRIYSTSCNGQSLINVLDLNN